MTSDYRKLLGGSLVGAWGMELHFFGLWIFNFRSLKFGKNRSFCRISRGFCCKFRPLKNIFRTLENGHSIRHQSIPPLSAGRITVEVQGFLRQRPSNSPTLLSPPRPRERDGGLRVSQCPKGSKRCFPNGVFQIPHLGLRLRKTPSEDKKCLKTPVFSGILVPSALGDPDRPVNAPLWKTPFRKHRLLLLGMCWDAVQGGLGGV